MKFGMNVFFVALIAAAYLLAPIMLIWGWVRWITKSDELGRPFFLSFIGFILSSTAAMLAVSIITYVAVIHGFPFYDPKLLRICRWGLLLSVAGSILGFTGVSAPNVLRWQAPLAGLGMLAFWLTAALSQ